MTPPDLDRLFSIRAAAEDAPHHPALITRERTWTFAALAEAVSALLEPSPDPDVPADGPVVGHLTVETLLQLYARMEQRQPMVLLHPRWTEAERERVRTRLARGPIRPLTPSFPLSQRARGTPPPAGDSPPMAILFTSGTSGDPKGVVLSRRAFAASAAASAANLGWQAEDRWLLAMTPAHVGGLSIVTRCLAARKTVVLEPSPRFDPAALAVGLEEHSVTLLSLVPTMLHRLLALEPRWRPPKTLRVVLLGGAPAPPALLREAVARGVPVLTTYGMTETCSQVTTEAYATRRQERHDDPGAGPPLAGVELRIVPSGGEGEIQVRGPMVMEGYLPPTPSPFTEDGWLRTGDAGSLDEAGRLHPLGRRGDMILTGGENVFPAEVEAALQEHPAVTAACVVGIPDPTWGQIVGALLEVPGAEEGPEPVGQRVEAWLEKDLRHRLAPFKRPRRWRLVQALPQLPNGKVDRRRAQEILSC